LAQIRSLGDLRPEQLDQLTEFFKQYLKVERQQFQPLGHCDAKQAAALIEVGIKKFKNAK
jgi:inorganic pyrophosphatase